MQPGWLLIKTLPRREGIVASILERRGLEVFLPRTGTPRPGRSDDDGRRPLFPGYLFARTTDRAEVFPEAHPALGIAYVLGNGGQHSQLPDELIDVIRTRSEWPGPEPHNATIDGETTPARTDSFVRLLQAINGFLTGRGRVRVLLETVQQLVPLDPDAAQVAIAS